ncbi:MAG: hypothetical protein U1F87_00025 [Kiritimatiellia bacterium]
MPAPAFTSPAEPASVLDTVTSCTAVKVGVVPVKVSVPPVND